jgi:AmmeMemoRadiSam system protein B
MWFPTEKNELESFIKKSFEQKLDIPIPKKINGLIVPHAGYIYSGKIAGKAFSLIKNNKITKAIIIGPSHYVSASEPLAHYSDKWFTPLGEIKTFNCGFKTKDITKEHSIANQIPFLQMLGIKEIMPLMIGDISLESAMNLAEKLSKINALYIFSTDLSHFLPYDTANEIDHESIDIIEKIEFKRLNRLDACGAFPLLVMFYLCKILQTSPKLIEYANSGDVTGDKGQVVGYASFWF